jgi:hypothetical protein
MDTYQLVTQGSRSPIANVVDANYTIVAKMPKRFLPSDVAWMDGVHQRLRQTGAVVRSMRSTPGETSPSTARGGR